MSSNKVMHYGDPSAYKYDKSTYVVMPPLQRDSASGRIVTAPSPQPKK